MDVRDEKRPFLEEEDGQQENAPPPAISRKRYAVNLMLGIVLWGAFIAGFLWLEQQPFSRPSSPSHGHKGGGGRGRGRGCHSKVCQLSPKLQPENDPGSLDVLNCGKYRDQALKRFQGAIRIPTESNELMGPPDEDPRWEVFGEFHEYLQKTYPLTHQHLHRDVVNKYGLYYEWTGSDESLKPVVLMAHQDVVPVLPDTTSLWTYPPYSAHFDGQFIWGRGSSDDKNPLISIMEAVELLLQSGHHPKRTVILSFGYDEESSGAYGAKYLAKHIEDKFGPDSVHALIDEGSMGVFRLRGTDVALVSVAEKGNYGAEITLNTHGGHSSAPPDHTGIGIVADLVKLVEATPHHAALSANNPMTETLHCIGRHSETLDRHERRLLLAAGKCKRATQRIIKALSDYAPQLKYLFQTSQAVDIIDGGLKINALPEKVTVRIDNRVSVDADTRQIEQKLLENVKTIAKRYNVGVRVNNETVIEEGDEYFDFKAFNTSPLEPAPYSPTHGDAYDEFAGTVRHVFEDFGGDLLDVETNEWVKPHKIVVTPSMMTGNTDTRFYWNLTHNIYRFNPSRVTEPQQGSGLGGGIHTVNEHIDFNVHVEGIAFYRQYILNLSNDK